MLNSVPFLSSIRVRLMLLILFATVPALFFAYYNAEATRERELLDARANMQLAVEKAVLEIENQIHSTLLVNEVLAEVDAVREFSEPDCSRILRRATQLWQVGTVLVGRNGYGICSSFADDVRGQDFSHRSYLNAVFSQGKSYVGAPVIGQMSKKASIPIAVPVRAPSGEVRAVLATGIDLVSFSRHFLEPHFSHNVTFTLFDEKGELLYRYPDSEKWIHQPQRNTALIDAILEKKESGALEIPGLDDVLRIYGFSPLKKFSSSGLYIAVGVARNDLLAQAETLFWRTQLLLFVISLIALIAAWLLAFRKIWYPVRKLTDTANHLVDGDCRVRIGPPYWRDELGILACTFDRMAAAAQLQLETLRSMNAQLEIRVDERTRALENSRSEVLRKNEALETASQMKSEFLANMSHELRTPLNAIVGFSEVLKDGLAGELSPTQKKYCLNIFSSGEHLLSLINEILDLSKVEAGVMVLDAEAVDVRQLLDASLLIVREKAMAHHIALRLDLPVSGEGFPGLMLADSRKLKQILYNLLSNAVKFSGEHGEVTLHARVVPRSAAGRLSGQKPGRAFPLPENDAQHFLEIMVCDTGAGIPEAGLSRLFQPFSQIDSSLSRKFEGTGLGLVMIRKLAELHGGCVAVESIEGEGACFTVWLPWRDAAATTVDHVSCGAVVQENAAGIGKRDASLPLALIVEDDVAAGDLLSLYLESDGFAVQRAANAEEALRLATASRFALLTIDILLPGMDGWELLRKVRAMPGLAHLPVVIVSIVADKQKGIALGASAVLQKPVSREVFSAVLADLKPLLANQLQPFRVLIADDDPLAIELLASYLKGDEFVVLRATDGHEAIERARHEHPDILLLDLFMPGMNGFDVVQTLKKDPVLAKIPVVVITARSITPDERAQLNDHVLRVLKKSGFSREDFIEEVHRALHAKTGKQNGETHA